MILLCYNYEPEVVVGDAVVVADVVVVGDAVVVTAPPPVGILMEQLAEPSAPVTVVTTETEVIPGPSLRVIVPRKVPSAAVVVFTVTLAPTLLVATIVVGRFAVGGVTEVVPFV